MQRDGHMSTDTFNWNLMDLSLVLIALLVLRQLIDNVVLLSQNNLKSSFVMCSYKRAPSRNASVCCNSATPNNGGAGATRVIWLKIEFRDEEKNEN